MNREIDIFLRYESEVRSYCRSFPTVFKRAQGSYIFDEHGNAFLDFLCGAGSINYGHNNSKIKASVIKYLQSDGIMMSLDQYTAVKGEFIKTFVDLILKPRKLNYKLQFTSPTGTSSVESAIKLARKKTGRENVISFTNAYHGMTGVALSLTGNRKNRQSVPYGSVGRWPYDNYLGSEIDALTYCRKMIKDKSSGMDFPAAIILETIQGEGGVNVASVEWLQEMQVMAKELGALLIIDDVQAGCGRSGQFFSFERAGLKPDIICLSKSIGAVGFPMALLLIKPDNDVWNPGEDNGTFRGNNLAFVAATEMLNLYWTDNSFEEEIFLKAEIIEAHLIRLASMHKDIIVDVRGIGLMQGIEFRDDRVCSKVAKLCFSKGLIIETSGASGQVLKLMPALTTSVEDIKLGLGIISEAVDEISFLSIKNSRDLNNPSVALERC